MDEKRKIEILIGSLFIVLLFIIILGVLYFDSKGKENNESFKLYERHSVVSLNNGIYYGEENARRISYENGVYKEEISRESYLNFKNRIFLEDEYYFQRVK